MARYKYDDDLPYIVVERHESGGGMLTFLWGALIGAGVALLYAPRSGEETRAEIAGGARRLRKNAEDAVRGVQDSVVGKVSGIRNAVGTGKSVARESRAEMERKIREARAGFESGARAGRVGAPYVDEDLDEDDDV
ncbi:MAG TPA: YtxH domain-containing protein [Longimicrobiales bacterium]|nr:YtxH domain-containing protein [Longimicrobiales bacterium]